MQQVGLIIRADGRIPIDVDHPHRDLILNTIKEHGYELEHESDCDHHKGHTCSCSPKIKNWTPHADVGRS